MPDPIQLEPIEIETPSLEEEERRRREAARILQETGTTAALRRIDLGTGAVTQPHRPARDDRERRQDDRVAEQARRAQAVGDAYRAAHPEERARFPEMDPWEGEDLARLPARPPAAPPPQPPAAPPASALQPEPVAQPTPGSPGAPPPPPGPPSPSEAGPVGAPAPDREQLAQMIRARQAQQQAAPPPAPPTPQVGAGQALGSPMPAQAPAAPQQVPAPAAPPSDRERLMELLRARQQPQQPDYTAADWSDAVRRPLHALGSALSAFGRGGAGGGTPFRSQRAEEERRNAQAQQQAGQAELARERLDLDRERLGVSQQEQERRADISERMQLARAEIAQQQADVRMRLAEAQLNRYQSEEDRERATMDPESPESRIARSAFHTVLAAYPDDARQRLIRNLEAQGIDIDELNMREAERAMALVGGGFRDLTSRHGRGRGGGGMRIGGSGGRAAVEELAREAGLSDTEIGAYGASQRDLAALRTEAERRLGERRHVRDRDRVLPAGASWIGEPRELTPPQQTRLGQLQSATNALVASERQFEEAYRRLQARGLGGTFDALDQAFTGGRFRDAPEVRDMNNAINSLRSAVRQILGESATESTSEMLNTEYPHVGSARLSVVVEAFRRGAAAKHREAHANAEAMGVRLAGEGRGSGGAHGAPQSAGPAGSVRVRINGRELPRAVPVGRIEELQRRARERGDQVEVIR